MGWNAGGFGSMTFPSTAALEAWRASTVSHAAYADWFNELETTYLPEAPVADRLVAIARGHDPKSYAISQIAITGTEVRFVYGDSEDGFRDNAGEMAAVLRGAAAHGATGVVHFLGTAGAEGDFAYELGLDGKTSTLTDLSRPRVKAVYASPAYRAFMEQTLAMLEAGNPAVRKAMTKLATQAAQPPPTAPATLDGILGAFTAKAPDVQTLQVCGHALRKLRDPALVGKLAKLLGELGKRAGHATISPAGFLVGAIGRRKDLGGLAPALARFATSKGHLAARQEAAELVLAWGDRDAMATIATRVGEWGGIGPQAGRAMLALDPAAAFAYAQPIARAKRANDPRDTAVYHLMEALGDDLTTNRKQALVVREPRWVALLVELLGQAEHRKDPYLAYNALGLLAALPRDPKVVARVEALLARGKMEPIEVIDALKKMKSTKWKAIVKQRLAKTTDAHERDSLERCL